MKLKSVKEIIPYSKVVLRIDTDLPIKDNKILDNSRLLKSLPTIKLLLEKNCQIIVLGHRGRPDGYDKNLSLKMVYLELISLIDKNEKDLVNSVFIDDVNDTEKIELALEANKIIFLENLRFWKEEEENDQKFLQNIVDICQFYVDDAFAVAHRKNTSITLFRRMPALYGLSFTEEAEKIGKILDNPQRPITVVLGGAKEDKLNYLPDLLKIADNILIGGKLPIVDRRSSIVDNSKIIWAELSREKTDLSEKDIEKFKEIISNSKTIVWSGALGYYEKEENRKGTEEIAKTIGNAKAYKVIAGGDTSASIINLGLKEKIDYICSGGGVMLEYLTKGKLAAWEN